MGAVGFVFADEAAGVLTGLGTIVDQGEAAYIRDREPQGVIETVGLAGARAGCRVYGANPGQYDLRTQQIFGKRCGLYLESIGQALDGGAVGSPVVGGQCPVLYNVSVTSCGTRQQTPAGGGAIVEAGFCSTPANYSNLLGPILGVQRRRDGDVTRVFLVGGFGELEVNNFDDADGAVFFTQGWQIRTAVVATRVDGLPDDCGDGPIQYDPDYPGPPAGPTFTVNPTVDIDINFTVEILPDANIRFDFGDGPETRPILPEDDPGGGGDEPEPGDQGEPGSGGEASPGEDQEDEAPPGEVLVGVLLTVTSAPSTGESFIDDTVFRWPCWVYMGGDDGLELHESAQFVRNSQFVYAKVDNATRYRVVANVGFSVNVVPYYRPVETEE